MPAEPTRRFRIGEVPPLTDGFADRSDSVGGLADVLVPGSAVALLPDPALVQTLPNWPGAGDSTAAGRLLTRSLADHERLLGPRDPLTLTTRERLAAACLADGKGKDAIAHYKRVLADREKVLGRGHPDTIATAGRLSAVYQATGRMPAAMQLAERCRANSERVLGGDHADTLARMMNLAHLYYAVGRVGDTVALLHETAARCERVLPPGDPLTQAVRQSLANIGEG